MWGQGLYSRFLDASSDHPHLIRVLPLSLHGDERVRIDVKAALHAGGYGHLLADTSVGHGLGLDVHELPTLSQGSEVEIQENMVFCVEPWTLDYSDWSMGRNVEDTVRVTQDGTELLTAALDGLVQV